MLLGSLKDLVDETALAHAAETKFKALMRKAGPEAAQAFRAILWNLLSDVVRKGLFGG